MRSPSTVSFFIASLQESSSQSETESAFRRFFVGVFLFFRSLRFAVSQSETELLADYNGEGVEISSREDSPHFETPAFAVSMPGLLYFVAGNDIPVHENRIEHIEVRAFAGVSSQPPSIPVLAFLVQRSQMFQLSLALIHRLYFLPLIVKEFLTILVTSSQALRLSLLSNERGRIDQNMENAGSPCCSFVKVIVNRMSLSKNEVSNDSLTSSEAGHRSF